MKFVASLKIARLIDIPSICGMSNEGGVVDGYLNRRAESQWSGKTGRETARQLVNFLDPFRRTAN